MTNKVVVIEKDKSLCRMLERLFGYLEVEVGLISDERGLENLKMLKPSVIVLDADFSSGNGVDVLIKIRKTEGLRVLPVIIIFNEVDVNLIQKVEKYPPVDYIHKIELTTDMLKEKVFRYI
jgi:DNA-binding response OmpR family regulator